MASEKHSEVLKLIAFNRFKQYYKLYGGHLQAKLKAKAFFRAKIGKAYLKQWLLRMRSERADWTKLITASDALRECRLKRLFKTWHTSFLQRKMVNI